LTAAAGTNRGTVVSVNLSLKKGQVKTPVPSAKLVAGEGLAGDAHRGFGRRQVSLLMIESVEEQARKLGENPLVELKPGVFAENLTTKGLDLGRVQVGDEFIVGGKVRLRITQIGKECYTRCAVYHLVGDCIMPALGIFCEVLQGGEVRAGDPIEPR
jgi:MOSC domain-containing protein YiiM